MKNKAVVLIIILILAVLSLVSVYSMEAGNDTKNKTELSVSSEGPIDLSAIIEDIKTGSYYKGYDNETLSWMESLGDKQVFNGNGTIVIMDKEDAMELKSEYATDVYIEEFIKCNVIENRSLGDVDFQKDVLLVENVKYVGEEIHYFQV